jgi:predicted HicB family RNase H-like nuclease
MTERRSEQSEKRFAIYLPPREREQAREAARALQASFGDYVRTWFEELIEALPDGQALHGPRLPRSRRPRHLVSVDVKLSRSEHERFKSAARRARVSIQSIGRRALQALIEEQKEIES